MKLKFNTTLKDDLNIYLVMILSLNQRIFCSGDNLIIQRVIILSMKSPIVLVIHSQKNDVKFWIINYCCFINNLIIHKERNFILKSSIIMVIHTQSNDFKFWITNYFCFIYNLIIHKVRILIIKAPIIMVIHTE